MAPPCCCAWSPEDQQPGEAEEDSLMLGLFLDFLSRQALTVDQGPVLYSEAMAAEDDALLAGVTVGAALVQRGELPEDWQSLQRKLDAG